MSERKTIVPVKRSALHTRVLQLVRKMYPGYTVEEETRVVTSHGKLPIDILIRDIKVAIECHGIQHFQYTAFFHRVPEDFTAQRQRDDVKQQAIKEAGWSYVMIRYDEIDKLTTTKLAKKILAAIKETA